MKKKTFVVIGVLIFVCFAFLWNKVDREEKIKLLFTSRHYEYFGAVSCLESSVHFNVYIDMKEVRDIRVGTYVDVYYNEETRREDGEIELIATSVKVSNYQPTPLEDDKMYKPVIYLYPKEKENISVSLKLKGKLTHTIPTYQNGWEVTADPDGTLTDVTGKKYPYLFWEADCKLDYDMSKGFCIPGEETEEFLEEKLSYMGLNEKEIADFMEFWVPYMKSNPYNKICFQTSVYTENVKLNVSPKPDSMLRVYMVYQPLERYVEIQEQTLVSFERNGFSVIEWGGAIIN